MNRIFFSIVFILLPCFTGISGFTNAGAQDLESFENRLQTPDSTVHSRVVVVKHGEAATAVRAMQARRSTETIKGYRVTIFSDNSQNARALATNAENRFKELFPDVPVDKVYKNPSFIVKVGYFRTSEEAVKLQKKIEAALGGRPVVITEDIPLSKFGE